MRFLEGGQKVVSFKLVKFQQLTHLNTVCLSGGGVTKAFETDPFSFKFLNEYRRVLRVVGSGHEGETTELGNEGGGTVAAVGLLQIDPDFMGVVNGGDLCEDRIGSYLEEDKKGLLEEVLEEGGIWLDAIYDVVLIPIAIRMNIRPLAHSS